MSTPLEQDVLDLSRRTWTWMSDQDVTSLAALFHEEAVFVYMGATMSRTEELNVIETGQIHYRDVDIKDASVRIIENTAIVLTRLQLGAVVGGQLVSNPFVVTEVYLRRDEAWTLGSMSFTRLLVPA